jgi:hypothetical protein
MAKFVQLEDLRLEKITAEVGLQQNKVDEAGESDWKIKNPICT